MFSGIIYRRFRVTETTIVLVMLNICDCRCIRISICLILFFGTYNGNMKYNFIRVVFTRNIFLKQYVVKIIFSCLEISFKPVLFKIKPLFWSCWLTFKFRYWLLCLFLFLKSLLYFYNNCPFNFNNMIKQAIFKTNLLN